MVKKAAFDPAVKDDDDLYNSFFSQAKENELYFNREEMEQLTTAYRGGVLLDALGRYLEYEKGRTITFPRAYFMKVLDTVQREKREKDQSSSPPRKSGPTSNYPFTDGWGATWYSYEYAEKAGRWYKKHLIEDQNGGFDVIMRQCEKPHIETEDEKDERIARDKESGLYQAEAQKFFDIAKTLAGRLDANR